MSKALSFYYYLQYNPESQYVKDFCETFKDNLDILPKHIVSSKKIITLLQIHSFNQFKIFSNVFNQYYKSKLLS